MKVVYHHRTRGNGAEGVHVMGIVRAYRDMGHDVSLLSLPGSDPEANVAEDVPGSEIVRKKNKSWSKTAILFFISLTNKMPEFVFELVEVMYNFVAFWRVYRRLSSKRADFLYERYSLFMFGGVLAAKLKGLPVVIEVNDSAIVERVRPLSFCWVAQKIESWVMSHCQGIVFISSAFKQKVESAYGNIAQNIVCPNAANLDQFAVNTVDGLAQKKKLGLENKLVCGYVGAFVYWHGIDWFVEEIAPALKNHPDLVLLLVGDGVAFPNIEKLVREENLADQIILPGRVPHKDISLYIAAMDYGILPDSNDYGSPMKLFEMMAMGIALVSPAYGPIDEVIDDDVNGWLFPPKDKKAAVKKVLALTKNEEEIKRVGQLAASYIAKERQWKHNVQGILELIT